MRYWDLFLYFVSFYNSLMKLVYISATAYTIYLMKKKKPYCLVFFYYKSHMIKQMMILSILKSKFD